MEITITYDVVLTHKQGFTTSNYRVYGRPIPQVGETVILPVGARTVRGRVISLARQPDEAVQAAEISQD